MVNAPDEQVASCEAVTVISVCVFLKWWIQNLQFRNGFSGQQWLEKHFVQEIHIWANVTKLYMMTTAEQALHHFQKMKPY